MPLIETLLDQDAFAALILVATVWACASPARSTWAFLAFGAGYFSTQVPLLIGWEPEYNERLFAQAAVSTVTAILYQIIGQNRYLLACSINEALMIAINGAWVILNWHPWFHWALFAIINYISLFLLVANHEGGRRVRRSIPSVDIPSKNLGHVYTRGRHSGEKLYKGIE